MPLVSWIDRVKKLAAEWAQRPAGLALLRCDEVRCDGARWVRAGCDAAGCDAAHGDGSTNRSRPSEPRAEPLKALGLGPLRLEPRRVLSATIQSLVVPEVAVEGDTVEVSAEVTVAVTGGSPALQFDWTVTRDSVVIDRGDTQNFSFTAPDDGSYTVGLAVVDANDGIGDARSASLVVENAPPQLFDLTARAIAEGETTTLSGRIVDPGSEDTFRLEIRWGDPRSPGNFQRVDLADPGEGVTFDANTGRFTVEHRYLDDPSRDTPGGEPTRADYAIFVSVIDDDGGRGFGATKVSVSNVPPRLAEVAAVDVDENGVTTLTGRILDPGRRDAFTLTVNWQDGEIEEIPLEAGTTRFAITHKYLDDQPGDKPDTFLIRLTLIDDDHDETVDAAQAEVKVGVRNVPPVIDPVDDLTIDEGEQVVISLPAIPTGERPIDPLTGSPEAEATFGVRFTDVGRLDTHVASINWGDGTPVEPLFVNSFKGGGDLMGAHTYADNGHFTATITVTDDDGGQHARDFVVTVNNVAPTLKLEPTDDTFVILEGETITIRNLGAFTDPGFNNDNLDNPAGPTRESFTYLIDWGDGSEPEVWLPVTTVNGGPGVATSGSLTKGDAGLPDQPRSHRYADNDGDNRYTVKVTLYDDDATLVDGLPIDGFDVKQFEVFVYNVNPTLEPVAATDLEGDGITVLTLTWSDLGEEALGETPADDPAAPWTVLVDWANDGTFTVEETWRGETPHTFHIAHRYTAPPNPENPAEDITIAVKIHDDAAGTDVRSVRLLPEPPAMGAGGLRAAAATGLGFEEVPASESGVSEVLRVTIDNPGIEDNNVAIDTTPEAPPLEFPAAEPLLTRPADQPAATSVQSSSDDRSASSEITATSERYLLIRVIRPDGVVADVKKLPADAIEQLPELLAQLPDNHYRVYLVQTETGSERLVLDVQVRGGKLIDPSDESEGARDRPPTSEPAAPDGAEINGADSNNAELNNKEPTQDDNTDREPNAAIPAAGATGAALVGAAPLVGLVAMSRCSATKGRRSLTWREEIEQALERSTEAHWRRLRWRRRPR